MNKKKAIVIDIKGIKCDSCDYKDEQVTFEQYQEYLNKPCPKCGAPLLTQADYDACVDMIATAEIDNMFFNLLFPDLNTDDMQYVHQEAIMNGSGKVEFVPKEDNYEKNI